MMYDWHKLTDPTLVDENSLRVNEIRAVKCREKKYCLVRGITGYRLVDEQCPHAYGKLSQGWCEDGKVLICPVHRLKFDIETGKETSGEGYAICSLTVEVREDGFYVGFPQKKWFEFW